MSTDSKFKCLYCKKSYKNKSNLNKHLVLCELIHTSKNKKQLLIEEEDNNLPSQKQLYQMLLELAFKYNKLEEKMDLAMKWIDKKKKKINILDWLQINIVPNYIFDNLSLQIEVTNLDVEFLFNNSFIDTLNELFSRVLYNQEFSQQNNKECNKHCDENRETNVVPIFAFVQKINTIYIYNSVDPLNNFGWIELSREKFIYFLNKIHFKFVKVLNEWKKQNQKLLDESERALDLYNKTLIKLMGVEFKQENILSKIRSNMYNKMKTDMKSLIEYELEF